MKRQCIVHYLLLTLMTLSATVRADLPKMEDPSRGKGAGIMDTLKNYGYDMVIQMLLAVCAVAFLVVANSCISTDSEIQNGKNSGRIWGRWPVSGAFCWRSSSGC